MSFLLLPTEIQYDILKRDQISTRDLKNFRLVSWSCAGIAAKILFETVIVDLSSESEESQRPSVSRHQGPQNQGYHAPTDSRSIFGDLVDAQGSVRLSPQVGLSARSMIFLIETYSPSERPCLVDSATDNFGNIFRSFPNLVDITVDAQVGGIMHNTHNSLEHFLGSLCKHLEVKPSINLRVSLHEIERQYSILESLSKVKELRLEETRDAYSRRYGDGIDVQTVACRFADFLERNSDTLETLSAISHADIFDEALRRMVLRGEGSCEKLRLKRLQVVRICRTEDQNLERRVSLTTESTDGGAHSSLRELEEIFVGKYHNASSRDHRMASATITMSSPRKALDRVEERSIWDMLRRNGTNLKAINVCSLDYSLIDYLSSPTAQSLRSLYIDILPVLMETSPEDYEQPSRMFYQDALPNLGGCLESLIMKSDNLESLTFPTDGDRCINASEDDLHFLRCWGFVGRSEGPPVGSSLSKTRFRFLKELKGFMVFQGNGNVLELAHMLSCCPRFETIELLVFAKTVEDFDHNPALLVFNEIKSMDLSQSRDHGSSVGVREGALLDLRIIPYKDITSDDTDVSCKPDDEEAKRIKKQLDDMAYNEFISDGSKWIQRPKPRERIRGDDNVPWGDRYIIHPEFDPDQHL